MKIPKCAIRIDSSRKSNFFHGIHRLEILFQGLNQKIWARTKNLTKRAGGFVACSEFWLARVSRDWTSFRIISVPRLIIKPNCKLDFVYQRLHWKFFSRYGKCHRKINHSEPWSNILIVCILQKRLFLLLIHLVSQFQFATELQG